ncbi:MAG: leucyl/phenylalanyl-tRNA---protein transferase [Acidimicrobiaceae bacterium]|nr:leucyl/phenylalanyl-tRNA---protein transferase [Acidimicrobiaceae bacterium]
MVPPVPPVEPPPSRWVFPNSVEAVAAAAGDGEVIGAGADLEPGTILAAYRHGLFPMPVRRGVTAWWSPEQRGLLPLDGLKVSRSLRKSCTRYQIRVDTALDEVIDACADRQRPGAWISKEIKRAYLRLHHLGWVHSVEAWSPDGRLAGGLYGVAVGGLFAGESMFHRQPDASKVALVALVDRLRDGGASLLDVQWVTPHLASLGAVAIPRAEYHQRLAKALELPRPSAWDA